MSLGFVALRNFSSALSHRVKAQGALLSWGFGVQALRFPPGPQKYIKSWPLWLLLWV